jgi:hypothetical protein
LKLGESVPSSPTGPRRRWPKWLQILLFGLVGILLVPVWPLLAIAVVPGFIALVSFHRLSEWRLRRAMANSGRVRPWRLIAEDAVAGRGTIIVETVHKGPTRLWWTEKKVTDEFGEEPPKLNSFELTSGTPENPFSVYCWRQYLNPQSGTALLIYPEPDLPNRGWTHHRLRAQFPDARVVETLHHRQVTT